MHSPLEETCEEGTETESFLVTLLFAKPFPFFTFFWASTLANGGELRAFLHRRRIMIITHMIITTITITMTVIGTAIINTAKNLEFTLAKTEPGLTGGGEKWGKSSTLLLQLMANTFLCF